jgi:hypothetical protein
MQASQTMDTGYGRTLMIVLALLAAISLPFLFRPRRPSSFTEHGAFGAGHGSESLMFGASGRRGAAR